MDYQLVLFDFDGLLVDTEKLHYAAYMEMSRRRGCPLDWNFAQFCQEAHARSMGFFDGLQREYPDVFSKGVTKELLYNEKKKIYVELLHASPLELMTGVENMLLALQQHQVKRAVVTNSPKSQVELIQDKIPLLKSVPLWITREDYAHPKPAPDGYLKAIEHLAKPGDRIIGFEDSLKGLQALIAAHVDAVLICPYEEALVGEALHLGARHFTSLQYETLTR